MAFNGTGTQTGTDSNASGLLSITGSTSQVIGNVTYYFIPTKLTIQGTFTFDASKERVVHTGNVANSIDINNGGTLTMLGGKATSSFGNNERVDTLPTAFTTNKNGPGCCSSGSLTIRNGGTLNCYGVRLDINACVDIENGSAGVIRNSVWFSHNADGNTRIRWKGATNWNIDGLKTFGIQLDWLTDQAFAQFINFLPSDRGIPIENAIGTNGVERLWRQLPDSRGTNDASMNNWEARKDVVIQLSEAGTGAMIVPDNCNGAGAGGHGGRIYHEFKPTAAAASGNKNGKAFVRDVNHSKRKATTSAGSIDHTADQFIIVPVTAGVGATTSILTGMWYRNNSVGDVNGPDGNEVLDARGKNDVTAVVADDAARDLFDVYFKGLDYGAVTLVDQQFNGLSETPVSFGLLVDTERDSDTEATINTYTQLETAQKAYNAMKVWSIQDANLETPTSSTFPLSKTGDTLNGGSFNLVFDGGAGSNFAFAAGTATIKAALFSSSITTTGNVSLDAIAEGRTIKDASEVDLTTYPTAITFDNVVVLLNGGTIGTSGWTLLNGTSYKLTADTTIVTGGAAAPTVDLNGFTLTVNDNIALNIILPLAGGGLVLQNRTKFDNYLGEYADNATAQAANPTPSSADYYREALTDTYAYYNGTSWVLGFAQPTELEINAALLGGPGALATQPVTLTGGDSYRAVSDAFGLFRNGVDFVAAEGVDQIIPMTPNSAPDASLIATAAPFAAQMVTHHPDPQGTIEVEVPDMSGVDPVVATTAIEIAQLDLAVLRGAAGTGIYDLIEVFPSIVRVRDDRTQIVPLASHPIKTPTQIPLNLEILNYVSVDPLPYDANNNRVFFDAASKSIVNAATIRGLVSTEHGDELLAIAKTSKTLNILSLD